MATLTAGESSRDAPKSDPLIRPSPWLFLDGMVLISVVAMAGAFLYFYGDTRRWLWQSLGYGWIPAGLWGASVLLALRYQAGVLTRRWRLWAVAASLIALLVCALSHFSPPRGLLEEVSYVGRWGAAAGGPSLIPVGLIKMVAIAALLPLVFYPRLTGPYYSRAVQLHWHWLCLGARNTYLGLSVVRGWLVDVNQRAARGRARRAEAREAARDRKSVV